MRYAILIFSFLVFFAEPSTAQTCPDLHLNGKWKTDVGTFFFRSFKTYQISQSGCYVLIYDTARKATWKVDLSGAHPIKAPAETVKANLEGAGPGAARNIERVEVKLTPTGTSSNFYGADLTTEVDLEATPRFPIDLKAHFGAKLEVLDNGGCSACSPGFIRIRLFEVTIRDMSKGIPQGVDKESFISGLNTALAIFLEAFSYKMEALVLVKD
ncbi:MAG: hypothetical protein V4760_11225 [Bdellovibrionota bacterium]